VLLHNIAKMGVPTHRRIGGFALTNRRPIGDNMDESQRMLTRDNAASLVPGEIRLDMRNIKDVDQLREVLRVLLDRDTRPSGEHVPEDIPHIAQATVFIMNNRKAIEYNLKRGLKP